MIKRIEYLYTLYNNIFAYTPLLHSFYEEYIGQDKDILLSYLILPLVLNETSRNKLVKLTARSSLFTFCKYEECIIGLPERIKQYRIAYPMTQKELADKSMVSQRSISRFENGEDITMSNLIKLMQALGIGGNLEVLVPDYTKRPSHFIESEGKRMRAGKKKVSNSTWKWGDEI